MGQLSAQNGPQAAESSKPTLNPQFSCAASIVVLLERLDDSKPEIVGVPIGVRIEAYGRADEPRAAGEGAAAHDSRSAPPSARPSTAINWSALIVEIPTVFRPLPNVTEHAGETEWIRREAVNWGRLFSVPSGAATIANGIA